MIKRIVTIVGARPQFIKASVLSRLIKVHPLFEEVIVHTGQHFDANMSAVFFNELNIPQPKYSLNISGGSHGSMTGSMLEGVENILIKEKPDAVLVYGDTNSTLAGALAASKLNIPVVHVESGLRSYNRAMPEEINRVLTDHMSQLLLCPTKTAVENLKKEGIIKGVHNIGDIMYDSTLYAIQRFKSYNFTHLKHIPEKFGLITVHRQESTNTNYDFEKIINFALTFAKEKNISLVFPVHPRIKDRVKLLSEKMKKKIILIDPLSYIETQFLLSKAAYVLTDSGGLQKEAYFHRVPCITLRSETEWVETIEHGWNKLWEASEYRECREINDYGQGNAANKILRILEGCDL